MPKPQRSLTDDPEETRAHDEDAPTQAKSAVDAFASTEATTDSPVDTSVGSATTASTDTIEATPRILIWVREHDITWLCPPVAVVLTGWLSAHTDTRVVAYWLGVIAAVVGYAITLLALQPSRSARSAAACLGAVAGLGATALLLHSTGHQLLRW